MTSSPSSSRPRLPLPTLGALLLAGTGLFLFFAATNVQSGWLYALDALLWAVWSWDLVSAGRRVADLQLTRLVPLHVGVGTTTTVVVHVRAAKAMRGIEVAEAGLEPAAGGKRLDPVPLGYIREAAAGETVTLRGTLTAPSRGRYAFVTLRFTTHGPFGLFRRPQSRTLKAPLWVHPVIQEWQGGIQGTDAEGNASGSTRRMGQVGIFAGVRDYRPGDSLRQIHWPLTARRGSLSVKELEPPPVLRATVVVQLSGQGPETEAAVATAANLIADFWQRGIPLGLVGPDRAWEPARWEEILEWLAELRSGDLPELPQDAGAIVVVSDGPMPGGWHQPVAAAFGPRGGAIGQATVQPLDPIH
jgi:uncharacterized protein (DUF58 family)